MRHHFLSLFLLLLCTLSAGAQGLPQSFIITPREDGWGIAHTVAPGETVFSLARRFHIPPSILAESNGLTYNDGLTAGTLVFLPLGAYNQKAVPPKENEEVVRLMYKMRPQDNLYLVSRKAGVSQSTLATWNSLLGNNIAAGQMLQVGWVLYDPTPVMLTTSSAAAPPKPKPVLINTHAADSTPKYILHADTVNGVATNADTLIPSRKLNSWQEAFLQQTNSKTLVNEKVSAGFFTLAGNSPDAARFAFHNTAAKGTIIKVRNIGNGKTVYVKVLGPVPASKQYAGCSIGLSNAAKAALGVKENKAFVELTYAGY